MSHQGYYLHPETGKPVTAAEWSLGITQEEYDQQEKERLLYSLLEHRFPELKYYVVTLPCSCFSGPQLLKDAITHLNDFEEWKFDMIANWLDTLPIRKETHDRQ